MYGLINIEHFNILVKDVVRVLGNGANDNADLFCEECCYAETDMARYPDKTIYGQGASILQFDEVRLRDIKMRTSFGNLRKCTEAWGIDILKIEMRELDYNPLLAIILWRLAMLKIPKEIPTTQYRRAQYWKKYWNSNHTNAKGTVNHYMIQNQPENKMLTCQNDQV